MILYFVRLENRMSEFHGDTEEFRHDHINDESKNGDDDENETLESDVSDDVSEINLHGIDRREGNLRIMITRQSMASKQCTLIERLVYYVFFPMYLVRDLNEVMWG